MSMDPHDVLPNLETNGTSFEFRLKLAALHDDVRRVWAESRAESRPRDRFGRAVIEALTAAYPEWAVPQVLRAISGPNAPPAGIFGAGVVFGSAGRIRPALFVLDDLLWAAGVQVKSTVEISEVEIVGSLLATLEVELPDGLVLRGLRPVRQHARPGDEIRGQMNGTVGPLCTRNGVPGFLTAGHVAPVADAAVRYGPNNMNGSVGFAEVVGCPDCPPRWDVAFVETTDPPTPELPARAADAQLLSRSTVRARGYKTSLDNAHQEVTAMLTGFSADFAFDYAKGSWKDVWLTGRAISRDGDSGAAVVSLDRRRDSDTTCGACSTPAGPPPSAAETGEQIAGMIVGGDGNSASVLHGITDLLAATAATL